MERDQWRKKEYEGRQGAEKDFEKVNYRETERLRRTTRETQFDDLFTILIDGLHPKVDPCCLRFMCKEFGIVMDSYIPQKLRKASSSRFGFIRFKTKIEAYNTICVLDGTRRYGNVISVSMAKYGRKNEDNKNKKEERKKPDERKRYSYNPARRIEHKTYSEAVKIQSRTNTEKKSKICAKSKEKEWLKNTLIGTLPNSALCRTIGDICRSEGVSIFDIKSIAGPYVLLIFEEHEEMKEMMSNGANWLMNWFTKIEPWIEDWSSSYRFTWLSCVGISIHGWDYDTFYKIGNQWREFIEIDESTRNERNFDRERIPISTSHQRIINEQIELSVDKKSYDIRVMEEHCPEIQLFESRFRNTKPPSEDEQSSHSQAESPEDRFSESVERQKVTEENINSEKEEREKWGEI